MKRLLPLLLLGMASWGCLGTKGTDNGEHVVLVRKASDKLLLAITKREWGGLLGLHGYVGYRHVGYWAALGGAGPIFVNPHFQDNPSDFQCKGTITLDTAGRRVTIEMWRIVSKPGEPERIKPHPANGTFTIERLRDARPEEAWF